MVSPDRCGASVREAVLIVALQAKYAPTDRAQTPRL